MPHTHSVTQSHTYTVTHSAGELRNLELRIRRLSEWPMGMRVWHDVCVSVCVCVKCEKLYVDKIYVEKRQHQQSS